MDGNQLYKYWGKSDRSGTWDIDIYLHCRGHNWWAIGPWASWVWEKGGGGGVGVVENLIRDIHSIYTK